MPEAGEIQYEVVIYFWLNLSQFGDIITKFIPFSTAVNERSYVCFLFVDQRLFNISIRLFYGDIYRTYGHLSVRHQRQKSSIKPLISPQP